MCTILFLRAYFILCLRHYVHWLKGIQEVIMALHEHDDCLFNDYNYQDDESEDLSQKKKVKRLLEERLERKRLKDEWKEDFDELNGEFNWDDIE